MAWPVMLLFFRHLVPDPQLRPRESISILFLSLSPSLKSDHSILEWQGGLCLDLSRMNRVIQVNDSDFDVIVDPGVTWRDLNSYLRDTGLWFPVGE